MTDETPAQTRRRRRVMSAFDTNPMICARCDITFVHLHGMVVEKSRAELWHHLPDDWKEGKDPPTYKPWKPCQHPQDCKVEPRLRELLDDTSKPVRFPGAKARAARRNTTPRTPR